MFLDEYCFYVVSIVFQEIVGIFAKDLTNAVSLSVNIKYQIIVYGQTK